MTNSRKWTSAIHSASCCRNCINVQYFFPFYANKIQKTDKLATTDTYNRNKRFTKLSCYSDKEFDKTDWVSGFINDKVHELPRTHQRIEKNSQLSYTKATNKPALFWKQRRNYLSIEWEKLTINPTSVVCVFPRLYSHRLYLHPNGR